MFQGLRTIIYHVKRNDLENAKTWYSELLGKGPYFDEPFYVGFNVGGFELGIDPTDEKIVVGNNSATYWGVQKITTAMNHCLEHGGEEVSAVNDVGGGIKVATVRDPFGNVLGLIENPHFKVE